MNWKPSAAVLCLLELVACDSVDCALNRVKWRLHIAIPIRRSRADKQKRCNFFDEKDDFPSTKRPSKWEYWGGAYEPVSRWYGL
jgi:hypothetical protein